MGANAARSTEGSTGAAYRAATLLPAATDAQMRIGLARVVGRRNPAQREGRRGREVNDPKLLILSP